MIVLALMYLMCGVMTYMSRMSDPAVNEHVSKDKTTRRIVFAITVSAWPMAVLCDLSPAVRAWLLRGVSHAQEKARESGKTRKDG